MASSRGRLPYPLQQESKINTSWYHKEDNSGKPICGSNTHALAQIIQTLIQNKQFDEAIAQINKCKDARELERDKRTNPDPAHDKYIVSLYLPPLSRQTLLPFSIHFSQNEIILSYGTKDFK